MQINYNISNQHTQQDKETKNQKLKTVEIGGHVGKT